MISIVIPTYNRASSLQCTLESISKQCCKEDELEIIVVDNGSTDSTKDLCTRYASVLKKFVYQYDSVPGLLTGRHKGAQLASGDIISFIDDDVELCEDWALNIEQIFKRYSDVHFVAGPSLPKYQVYPPSWIDYFWSETPYGGKMCTWLSLLDLGDREIIIDAKYVFGLNYSIRKNTLFELGGFHPDCIPSHLQKFQGDGETGLSIKANERGYKALYSPAVMLYHLVSKERTTASYFEKRAFYLGVGDSFTTLRKKNGLYSSKKVLKINNNKISKSLKRVYSRLSKITSSFLRNAKKEILPVEVAEIKKRVKIKYNEGYQFHQEAFNNMPEVRTWVLKENYWNYQLPEN